MQRHILAALMPTDLNYLDNAATSWPKPPEVGAAITSFLAEKAGNPGRGGHRLARAAGDLVEQARERLAAEIHAPCAKRMILTHGCTDSVNLAVHGVLRAAIRRCAEPKPHVVVSGIEHNAILRTVHCFHNDKHILMDIVPCDSEGWVDPAAVAAVCTPETVLVSVAHASNAVGTIQDAPAISRAVRAAAPEALFMVDAAQTLGHMPIDVEAMGIDLLAIAGHKGLCGPTGTGGLYVSERAYPDTGDSRVFCQRRGGTGMKSVGLDMPTELPDALEAGTTNAAGFAGLLAAMDARDPGAHEREMRLTGRILDELRAMPGITVHGRPGTEGRTPVVLFSIEGWTARDVGDILDAQHGICVRGGTHCAPLLHQLIGTGDGGAVRASPGWATTDAEIDAFLEAVGTLVRSPAPAVPKA
ncbi:MAG: cysteine desulfurase [Phycisphaeraceae bacterium]|nr:MAG: cysteine desulfurase [Phycisphaeraceae bacterium]